ncbi:nucleotidyltransferase family protein [Dokdonella sp.]|uniref:nucleotidyltransferase family protein n=1 Tax=Dokdonella sp. TaxID=2291710 RepID=UPI003C450DB0
MSDSGRQRHGVIVLAAGSSTRLGQAKQLLTIDGETLVHRAVRIGLETNPVDCVVVCGADAEMIKASVADLDCRVVSCADYRSGLSASMHTGLAALRSDCAAALILLTDQAALDADHLRQLCESWRCDPQRAAASGYADTVGVPAMLPRSWFPELARTHGDRGARDLLRARSDEVDVSAAPELAHDIDTPGDLVESGILKG